jgi:UDP:flavonoid glycosyltransferase YjiC (YdhE family)
VEQARADGRHSIVALVSERGGGDVPPVLALAAALCDRGHDVRLLCDGDVESSVRQTDLPALHLPREHQQAVFFHPLHLLRMTERGEAIEADTPNPLADWAQACLPIALAEVRPFKPTLLLSTLFCMALADRVANALDTPWVFVNPSFYFGDDARRAWEADFPGLGAGMFRHWLLPLAKRATAVLHATDPLFDPPPASAPENHRHVGPLVRERLGSDAPAFLTEPGDPWVLLTLSTVPQAGELGIARAALDALADRPVRVLVTLAPGHDRDELGPIPANARVAGFVAHDQVLDRASLMIGHAGHGMVMRGLRHGVPMVLVPWSRDQPGVAARAAAMGVAEVVPRSECTTEHLARAVDRVMGKASYSEAAQRAALPLRTDDPLGRACDYVEELLQLGRAPEPQGRSNG